MINLYMKKLRHTLNPIIKICAYLVVLCINVFSFIAYSNDDILQTQLASFSLTEQQKFQWIQISAIENKPEHFIALADNNQIYLVSPTGHQPLFSSTSVLSDKASITALTLHPNFSIRDQHGYLTLYIAHTEPFNNTRKFARVIDNTHHDELTHDLVITEWKMHSENDEIDFSTRREVIRIGVPSHQVVINQLAFNPYTKMWNDDFGLLYFSLNQDETYHKSPLYSGAILRINPLALGLKGYTVPINNPFTNQVDVNDEIFVSGVQSVKQFIWPNKDDNQLLISHTFNSLHQLSVAKGKDDWRESPPQTVVWQSQKPLSRNALVMYRGKALSHLWGRALVIHQLENHWQISSMLMPNQIGGVSIPTVEWQLPIKSRNNKKDIGFELFTIQNEELALLDLSSNNLNGLSLASSSDDMISDDNEEETEQAGLTTSNLMSWILFVLLSGFVFWAYRYNQKKRLSAKFIVRQQYGHLEVSESKQQIGLYRRHQQNAEVVLTITDIKQCVVALNGHHICEIDSEHCFNEAKEIDLRENFSKERREKMVPDKLRQLTINLVDQKNAHYPVCIYLRKGDHRITRKSYGDVIEDLLDWCWLYSMTINPSDTGVRKIPEVKPMVERKVEQNPPSLIGMNTSSFNVKKDASIPSAEISEPTSDNKKITDKIVKNIDTEPATQQSTIDTQLVNALDKLVKLKEQGYLSDEEFNAAKAKLLKDLTS